MKLLFLEMIATGSRFLYRTGTQPTSLQEQFLPFFLWQQAPLSTTEPGTAAMGSAA